MKLIQHGLLWALQACDEKKKNPWLQNVTLKQLYLKFKVQKQNKYREHNRNPRILQYYIYITASGRMWNLLFMPKGSGTWRKKEQEEEVSPVNSWERPLGARFRPVRLRLARHVYVWRKTQRHDTVSHLGINGMFYEVALTTHFGFFHAWYPATLPSLYFCS